MYEKARVKNKKQLGSLSGLFFAALTLAGCHPTPFPLQQTTDERSIASYHRSSDSRTWHQADDAEIALAKKQAMKRWPEFIQAFSNRPKAPLVKTKEQRTASEFESFEVKIPVGAGFATEHMWMHVSEISPKSITGRLDTTPTFLKFYQEGTEFIVPIVDVEDWIYGSEIAPVGAFTTMPLRKAKLQELLKIKTVNGKPSEESVAGSAAEIQAFEKRVAGCNPKQIENLMTVEMAKKDGDLNWYSPTLEILVDAERAINNTEHKQCTDKELAEACGLTEGLVQDLKRTDALLRKRLEDIGTTP